MSSRTLGLIALILSFSAAQPAAAQSSPPAEVLDSIVAVVNDGIILQSDLDEQMTYAIAQLASRGIDPPDAGALRSQVLDKMIMTKVQTQRAKQAGIRVDDRELNQVISTIAKQNNMTLSEFAKAIRRDGGDFLAVREQVRDDVTITRLRQREVDSRVSITDRDIELFLANEVSSDETEYRVSHILVSVPDGASPKQRSESREKARGLLKKIEDGEDFGRLAAEHSDGQQALDGGDLGWRSSDSLPILFLKAARKLDPGETSELLEPTSGGFHIIKLVETRGGEERQTVEEVNARHILIQPNAIRDEDAARLQARELHARIVGGEDFGELAKEFSDDPGSKNAGGDMGWTPPGVFVGEFQNQIESLQVGELSEPFHTQFGWHIAEVLGHRTRDVTRESRRARARGAIQNRKAAEEYDTWLRKLRAEAYVEFRSLRLAEKAEQDESQI